MEDGLNCCSAEEMERNRYHEKGDRRFPTTIYMWQSARREKVHVEKQAVTRRELIDHLT